MIAMNSVNAVSMTQVVLTWGTLVWAVYLIGRIIHNVYWHPLAKFPGPKLRAATFFPYYWAIWLGIEPLLTKKMHDSYGHVVRISPDTLSFNTAQSWKDIYGPLGRRQLPKNTVLAQKGFTRPLSTIVDYGEHARVRGLISPAFSERAMREQEPLIMKYVDLLIQRLKTQVQGSTRGEVNVVQWYNFATFDIIGDLSLGRPFYSLESGRYHDWISNIFMGVKKTNWIRIVNAYPILEAVWTFFIRLYPPSLDGQRVHRKYTRVAVEKRLATKTEKKDFLSYFSRGLTLDELDANAMLLLLAGSETSATALSGATYYLLTNDAALDKVCNEVRSAFQSDNQITFASVAQLPYLNAVIAESLRMYPPLPSTQPRFTRPEGNTIDGHFIPGNAIVGISQWAANRSEANFRNPDSFKPERWLGDPAYTDDQRAAVQTFSIGPRNCIGQTLAYAEIRSILARMLWHFDMELCEASRGWDDQLIFILWEKPALMIKLRERKSVAD